MPVKTNWTENFFLGCLCFFHNNPRLAKHYCCSPNQTVAQMAYCLCFDCFPLKTLKSTPFRMDLRSSTRQNTTKLVYALHYILYFHIHFYLTPIQKRWPTLDLIQWHIDVRFRMVNLAHPLLVIHWLGKWCLLLRSKTMSVIKDLYIYKWVIIPHNFCKGLMIFPQL